ncbi:MAG: Type 1 glutamine amidotransferase-like domain-containing protein [Chloroflexota bacterium]
MKGHIVLEGGSEFGGQMMLPDIRSMELAGGVGVPICIIPTAAAADNNHERAGNNGKRWFQKLGASNVTVLPLIDERSANDPTIIHSLEEAKLIYLLGGFPRYLGQTLAGSDAWQAMQQAYSGGAVISGSSAGAMVLCEFYYNPGANEIVAGLGLVPNSCVLPHHNTYGKRWAAELRSHLPDALLIGIDEQTGLIDDGDNGQWRAYGAGGVTLYRPEDRSLSFASIYMSGYSFLL